MNTPKLYETYYHGITTMRLRRHLKVPAALEEQMCSCAAEPFELGRARWLRDLLGLVPGAPDSAPYVWCSTSTGEVWSGPEYSTGRSGNHLGYKMVVLGEDSNGPWVQRGALGGHFPNYYKVFGSAALALLNVLGLSASRLNLEVNAEHRRRRDQARIEIEQRDQARIDGFAQRLARHS